MKILVLGASGILGQHLRLSIPEGITPVFVRRTADLLHLGCELTDFDQVRELLEREAPDVLINLAGESRPDVVEQAPHLYVPINVLLPAFLAQTGIPLVQVSTQAVFAGDHPPYGPYSKRDPVNAYGRQKMQAEDLVLQYPHATVVRPTFVLGVRPLPHVGRSNPFEQMRNWQKPQVGDRWFSVAFAPDVAKVLWRIAVEQPGGVYHAGVPGRKTRYSIAKGLGLQPEAVAHTDFPGLAARAIDTTYNDECFGEMDYGDGIADCIRRTSADRAMELSLFTGRPETECRKRLAEGFGPLHAAVNREWRESNPKTDEEMLDWYRTTDSYLWELSAYHADAGFNYTGMCFGICERLRALGAKRILCLGDGIGDLTLSLIEAGLEAVYHDLAQSRTAQFAQFRIWQHTGKLPECDLTDGWTPEFQHGPYDAAVSLDFLEHVTDVEAWTRAIQGVLKPGGFFLAQNAFAIGSGPEGSIPCHLERNDRFEKDWRPLLESLDFADSQGNWWQRAA